MNAGKVFEKAFTKSMPDYALLYRLPDPAQSFSGGSLTRFSRRNPFDFLAFSPPTRTLYALELKTVAGKSISFERSKGESGVIHYYQIAGLNDWNKYDGVKCGFVIEFREIETTVFIDIDEFNRLISAIEKKSFNFDDLQENEVDFFIIPQTKKRTQYTYDLEKFFNEVYEGKGNENE